MSSQDPPNRDLPPGTGTYSPGDAFREPQDHMQNWGKAVQAALDNFGRESGARYTTTLALTAVVEVENPGNIVEYIATFS